jgi:hypothetical protein
MTWPTTDAGTTALDSGGDDPRLARTDLLQAVQNVNAIKNHVSSQGQDLLAAATQATARAVIDAQEQTAALDALKALTPAAGKGLRFTGSGTAETFDLSDAAKAALAGANNTAILEQLGVFLDDYLTAVEAGETYQPYNALLSAIQALATNGFLVRTGAGTAEARNPLDIQVFATPGTYSGGSGWQKPAGAKSVGGIIMPGTGGGGSGRRGATGTDAFGGGGAGAAPMCIFNDVEADQFASQETVIVGAKGTGGAAVAVDSTNGNDGTNGGISKFGSIFQALGGLGGKGGTTTSGLGGQKQFIAISTNFGSNGFDANKGGDSGTTTTAGDGTTTGSATGAPYTITAVNGYFSTSAGAGGSITAANVAHAGQAGMAIYNQCLQTSLATGAAGGANTGAAGSAGATLNMGTHRKITLGGGGGGAALAAAGGKGGLPGGGGGASRNGNASGAGENGMDGYVVIFTKCGV